MASRTKPAAQSQNYQRFAWGTLAMAALVALFAADGGGSAPAPRELAVVAAAPIAQPTKAATSFNFQPDASGAQGETGEVGSEPGSADEAGHPPDPQLAEAGGEGAGEGAAEPQPGAPPADPARMIDVSHARSGGPAQGDDPAPRRAD